MSGGAAALAAIAFVVVVLAVFVGSQFMPERAEQPGNPGDGWLVLIVTLPPLALLFAGGCAVVSVALWIAGPVETW
jgi:hypothetical protein